MRRLRSRTESYKSEPFKAGQVRLGIGDDCAVLRLRAGEDLVVTTDLSIAGRHFRRDWHAPEAVGHRTLARGLSDLAAMGARPVAVFLSLGLPPDLAVANGRSRAWVDRFFDGFLALADAFKMPLAGGDLAESPVAVADVALIGSVPRGHSILRSRARPGDLLYVTGSLGGAHAGLVRLGEFAAALKDRTRPPSLSAAAKARLSAHLSPQPRIAQGLWLQRMRRATAAIDVSDGLSTDLLHICEESGVAAEVHASLLPVHPAAALDEALHGGEDYELLFTAAAGVRIPRSIAGVAVTRIGRILRRSSGGRAMTLLTDKGPRALEARGWEHFART
ncbi:MAG TPA: thiamine-phosphate kinase [Terriglobia bacterium]|nr:thiamine-phosphate kinase [Terriglobia bacterium]